MLGINAVVVGLIFCNFQWYYTFTALYTCGNGFFLQVILLHGKSVQEAVGSRKIHVQIMRFTCCLNMAFTWKGLNWALIRMHEVTLESVAAMTDHFADAFVCENVAHVYMTLWRHNEVWKFDADANFFFEKSRVRKCIFMFKRRFQQSLC